MTPEDVAYFIDRLERMLNCNRCGQRVPHPVDEQGNIWLMCPSCAAEFEAAREDQIRRKEAREQRRRERRGA